MGTIICDKHGMSGISINIQNDICMKILKNELLQDSDLEVIKVKLFDNNQFLFDINYIVTVALKKELSLLDVYEIKEEYEDEKLIKKFELKMGVVCGQCLNEYKYKDTIRNTLEKYKNHI
jgi:hypothetical protein